MVKRRSLRRIGLLTVSVFAAAIGVLMHRLPVPSKSDSFRHLKALLLFLVQKVFAVQSLH